jgi:hypothetical protein
MSKEEFIFWNAVENVPSHYSNKELVIENYYTEEKPPFKQEHSDVYCIHWKDGDKFISFKDKDGMPKNVKRVTSFEGFEYLVEWIKEKAIEHANSEIWKYVQYDLNQKKVENDLAIRNIELRKMYMANFDVQDINPELRKIIPFASTPEDKKEENAELKARILYAMYLFNFSATPDYNERKVKTFVEFVQIYK